MAASDAKPVPIKDTAFRVSFPILDADGDLVTGATTPDSEFSEDAATFADCASEATEIATSSGMYYLELASTEMGGDTVVVIVKTATAGAKTTPIVLYPQSAANPINVNVQAISTDSTAADNLELWFDGTGYNASTSTIGTATAIAAGGITASSIAADAIGASELAADAVAEIADAVWDEAMSGHLTLGTYGQLMRGIGLTGEVNDVAASTTVFVVDGFTEATDDHFNGCTIRFTSGANAGAVRTIIDYTGATQTITLGQALTDAPADNDDFVILPGEFGGGTLAQVCRLFVTILDQSTGQLDSGSLASGTITADSIARDAIGAAELADGAITAATFAAGAIDAAAIAAGAVDEILDEAMTEIGSVPAVTASFRDALRWMFALSRNKITQTATTQLLRNDADAATICTAAVSDDGTTAIRAEWA